MKKRRLNKKRIFCLILCVLCVAFLTGLYIDFVRFPECYMPAWRYQLKGDLAEGDKQAIEYYERVYIANGRELFEK